MKKFIIKGVLFVVLMIFVDFIVGLFLNYLTINAKSGGNLKNNYIAYSMEDELLIFGSSRAAHHYKPQVFKDSLGINCYNCGTDGNGIILMFGRYQLLKERYRPKIIIYDFTDHFDIRINDNIKYLANLKKYYDNPNIQNIFEKISPTEGIKMQSHMYRNNSTIINTVWNYISSEIDNNRGYLPMYKKMDIIPKKVKNSKTSSKNDIDEIKLFYLEQLIKECKKGKTKLFFTVSPFYFNDNDTLKYQPIKQLCTKYNIPFIKYDNTPFIENKDLFSDSSHLNDEGASEYSKYIVSIINAYL